MCVKARSSSTLGLIAIEDAQQPRGYRLVGDVDFDEVSTESSRDHAGSWRSRPNDDRDVNVEYG